MIRRDVRILLMQVIFAATLLIQGCHKGVVATTPVPPQQQGVVITPSPRHVWRAGKVNYRRGNYFWRRGSYKAKSNNKPIYVAGHWKQTEAGYVWVRGRWQKF
jgi:hypothetical protein